MHSEATGNGRSALASLRRYLSAPPAGENPAGFPRRAPPAARCELCSAGIAEQHPHVLELATCRLLCACEACAILFSDPTAAKFRRVSRRREFLPDFRLSEVQWQALQLPINLAFFVQSTPAEKVVALYPSPAGATEALPPPDAWDALVEDNPLLRKMQPDVEGLLVNRLASPPEHYLVGIDECYALVGVVRSHWRSMTGGTRVWKEIGQFFAGLRKRSYSGEMTSHA